MNVGIRERLWSLLGEAPADVRAVEHDMAWWSWGRLQDVATVVRRRLDAAELGPESRIGVVLENRPEHVAALMALLASGRCVVTLSPLQPAARLRADIARSALPAVIAGPDVLAQDGVLDAITANGIALELDRAGNLRDRGGEPRPNVMSSPGIAIEMLTSGTTGPPKRIRLSERQLSEALASGGQAPGNDALLRRSVSLVTTPLVHIGGMWAVLACFSSGRRLVLQSKFEWQTWVAAVERHKLRAAGLVPAALRTVLDANVSRARLASLEVVTSGTTACPPELADAFFRRYGIRVLTTYGATEFAGAVAGWTLSLHETWWDTKAGSTGRAFPRVELRVTGEDDVELSAGQTGRLEVRAPQTASGTQDWVRTSDLAYIDDDGFLWIVGRADDVIVRGGFKVQPETVKRVLEGHPAVREAAVAGLPDEQLGAVPVAAVQIDPRRRQAPGSDELIAFCRHQLMPYEVPKHVVVVPELPRTPSTKVSRVDLLNVVRAALALDEEVGK